MQITTNEILGQLTRLPKLNKVTHLSLNEIQVPDASKLSYRLPLLTSLLTSYESTYHSDFVYFCLIVKQFPWLFPALQRFDIEECLIYLDDQKRAMIRDIIGATHLKQCKVNFRTE